MDSWTKQRSFPIVTVSRVDQSTFKLSQQSFLVSKANITENSTKENQLTGVNDTLWHVPFTYMTDKDTRAELVWFNEKGIIIELDF